MKFQNTPALWLGIFLLVFTATVPLQAQLNGLIKKAEQATGKIVQPAAKSPAAAAAPQTTSIPASTQGRDFYVSPDGKGREGTKEAPVKDIAAIAALVQAGDRIHIATGIYTSRMDQSSDVFQVPVSIIGGYSPDFSKRDPWGQFQTVLSGSNDISKALTTERIGILTDKNFRDWNGEILIDGIIVDNSARNYYRDPATQEFIVRKASPEKGMNPTPDTPGIKVRAGNATRIIIRNCVVTNVAANQGAIDVQVGKDGSALIENNLIVNNTGEGIICKSNYHGDTGLPQYVVRNNTILFNWKRDAIASFGGNSIMFDNTLSMRAENNVFGFGDYGGVNNVKQCKGIVLKNNLFVGHRQYDYQEFATGLPLGEMDDYANLLSPESGGNYSQTIDLKLPAAWAEKYFHRKEVSRAEVDAAAKVSNSGANQLRAMFGLPLQAGAVGMDAEIWLHRLPLANALQLGQTKYGKGAGCSRP